MFNSPPHPPPTVFSNFFLEIIAFLSHAEEDLGKGLDHALAILLKGDIPTTILQGFCIASFFHIPEILVKYWVCSTVLNVSLSSYAQTSSLLWREA